MLSCAHSYHGLYQWQLNVQQSENINCVLLLETNIIPTVRYKLLLLQTYSLHV